ncbi:uncharacterized protein LAJ45_04777 [Morchella importuna]|nr:uncharacterized protein LAJ45_04777 [Morchella importuna]KAH8151075.1 hypothetical protein LAJ45_04777 [Morchella importuna]
MYSNILSRPSVPPVRSVSPSSDSEDFYSAEDPAYLPAPAIVAQEASTRCRSNALSLGLGSVPNLPPGLAPRQPSGSPPGLSLLGPPAPPAAAIVPSERVRALTEKAAFACAAISRGRMAAAAGRRLAAVSAAAAVEARRMAAEIADSMDTPLAVAARASRERKRRAVSPPSDSDPTIRQRAIARARRTTQIAGFSAVLAAANAPPSPSPVLLRPRAGTPVDEEPRAALRPATLLEQMQTRHGVINVVRPVEMEWSPAPPASTTAPQPAQGAVAMEIDREGLSQGAVGLTEVEMAESRDDSDTESEISSIMDVEILEARTSMDGDIQMSAPSVVAASADAASPPSVPAVVAPMATLISAVPPTTQLLAPRARPLVVLAPRVLVVPAPRAAPAAGQRSLFEPSVAPRVAPAAIVPALFAARDRNAPVPAAAAPVRSFGGSAAVSPLFRRVDNVSALFQRPASPPFFFGQKKDGPAPAAVAAATGTEAGALPVAATGTALSTPRRPAASASATPKPSFLRTLGAGEEFNFGVAAAAAAQSTPTLSVLTAARPAPVWTLSAPAAAPAAPPPAPVEVRRPLVVSSGVCFATPPPVDSSALFFVPAVPAPVVPSVVVPPAVPSLTEELVGQERVPVAVQPAPPAPVSSEVPEQAAAAPATEAVAAAAAPAVVVAAEAEAAEAPSEEPEAVATATATPEVAVVPVEAATSPAVRAASPARINTPVPVKATVQELLPVEVKVPERKAKARKVSSPFAWEDNLGLPDSPEPRTEKKLPAVAKTGGRKAMQQKAAQKGRREEHLRLAGPYVVSDSVVAGQMAIRAAGEEGRLAMAAAVRQRAQADATQRENAVRLRAARQNRRVLALAPAQVSVAVEAPIPILWSARKAPRSGRAHTWNPRTLVRMLSAFAVAMVAGLWVFGISGQATALVSDLVPESLSAVMGTTVSATLYSVCEKVSVCGRGGDGDLGRASHAIPNGLSSPSSVCFSCVQELLLFPASAGEITGDDVPSEEFRSEPSSALFQDVFGDLSCGLAVEEVPVLVVPKLVPQEVCWLYEAGMTIGTGEGIPVCELPAALAWGFPDYLLGLLFHGVRMV